jgi:hypothetical protein
MSKIDDAVMVALERWGLATAMVSYHAQALVLTASEAHGVRLDVLGDLRVACAAMREAQEALKAAQEALVVDTFGEVFDVGESRLAS